MVVFLLMREVMTPPAVSIPRDIGVTSSSSRFWTSSDLSPDRMAASTATITNYFMVKIYQTNQF
jgi:hypothetical protein